jgi:hypothetical protein
MCAYIVGTNLCVAHPLEEKRQRGSDELGGVAEKEAYTVHAINIISQRQYYVARCLISYVVNVFGLRSICVCFPSTRKSMM